MLWGYPYKSRYMQMDIQIYDFSNEFIDVIYQQYGDTNVSQIHMDMLIYIFSNAFADVYYGGIHTRMEKMQMDTRLFDLSNAFIEVCHSGNLQIDTWIYDFQMYLWT